MLAEAEFVPRSRASPSRRPRGWFRVGPAPSGASPPLPSVELALSRVGASTAAVLRFSVSTCADEKKVGPATEPYRRAPPGAFVFDARYLKESASSGADVEVGRENLESLNEAHAWWRRNRGASRDVVFFCVSGQNRSVTAALVFALSELASVGLDKLRWWRVDAFGPFGAIASWSPASETFVNFALRAVRGVRPEAFHKRGAEDLGDALAGVLVEDEREDFSHFLDVAAAAVEVPGSVARPERLLDFAARRSRIRRRIRDVVDEHVDWARLWVGRDENKLVVRALDAAIRSRFLSRGLEGARWLEWTLPPKLSAAKSESEREPEPEPGAGAGAGAGAEPGSKRTRTTAESRRVMSI
jgi:hypothetical protein